MPGEGEEEVEVEEEEVEEVEEKVRPVAIDAAADDDAFDASRSALQASALQARRARGESMVSASSVWSRGRDTFNVLVCGQYSQSTGSIKSQMAICGLMC